MPQDRFPAANLRVGHAEREAVAAILQQAAADGRLSLDELDERLGAALRAKTYADLEPLVADLSVDPPWRSHQRAVAPISEGPTPPGYSREDPLQLDGGVTGEKRDGVWTIPPFVRIHAGAASVKLNCLLASVAAAVIEIEVIGGAGWITIIVPEGWAANDDRLGKGSGWKTIKVPRTPAAGQPLLVLRGSVGFGSLKVRPPSARELRRVSDGRARRQ